MFRKGDWEPSDGTAVQADMLFLGLYLLEWLTRDPEVQVTGISFVYDCDGFSMRHLPYVDLAVFQVSERTGKGFTGNGSNNVDHPVLPD